jgi:hypothetical protein
MEDILEEQKWIAAQLRCWAKHMFFGEVQSVIYTVRKKSILPAEREKILLISNQPPRSRNTPLVLCFQHLISVCPISPASTTHNWIHGRKPKRKQRLLLLMHLFTCEAWHQLLKTYYMLRILYAVSCFNAFFPLAV